MKEGRCDWKRVKGWIDVIVKSRVKRGGGNLEIAMWRGEVPMIMTHLIMITSILFFFLN